MVKTPKPTHDDLFNKRNWVLGDLLSMAEEHCHNYGEFLGEFLPRMEGYALAVQHGILTVEEVRRLEGLSGIKSTSKGENNS